jgi:hypothetical protein
MQYPKPHEYFMISPYDPRSNDELDETTFTSYFDPFDARNNTISAPIERPPPRLASNGMLVATPPTAALMAVAKRNITTSPLLLLPPELRNRIF